MAKYLVYVILVYQCWWRGGMATRDDLEGRPGDGDPIVFERRC